jgi:hypothetical protein
MLPPERGAEKGNATHPPTSAQATRPSILRILPMAPEERELMSTLCQRIAEEKDSKTLDQLVCQLNEFLEKTQDPVEPDQRDSQDWPSTIVDFVREGEAITRK